MYTRSPMPQATPSLRRSATLAVLLVATATVAGAAAMIAVLPLSQWFLFKAVTLPAFWLAIVMPRLGEHGHASLGPANSITLVRGVLTALMAAFAYESVAESLAWWLVASAWAAFALDWVDGRVARATGKSSAFGARLDMELDALAVLALCALAHGMDRAGPWIYLSGALRYLFVAASFPWPWMDRPLYPTKRRAWTCGIQIVCLVACLVPWPWPVLSQVIAAVGTISLVGSFGIDTWWLFSRRNEP